MIKKRQLSASRDPDYDNPNMLEETEEEREAWRLLEEKLNQQKDESNTTSQ